MTITPLAASPVEVLRTNLCPNPRYIGVDGVAGGGAPNWTQTDYTTSAPDGRGYTRFTATAPQTGTITIGTDAPASAAVSRNLRYVGSAYVRFDQTQNIPVRAELRWYDAAGNNLGVTAGDPADAPKSGTWLRLDVNEIAPDDAATARITVSLLLQGDATPMDTGDSIRVAQRMIERANTLSEYFDGGTPSHPDGTATIDYQWTGDENASPSQELYVPQYTQLNPTGQTSSADTVIPDLVITYAHQIETNTTVLHPLSGGAPIVARVGDATDTFPQLPSGTFNFYCVEQDTALKVAEICTRTTSVDLSGNVVPGAPFTFAATGAVVVTWNTPYRSWKVDVPYVRLT